jgi:type I restriction enzyme S subunit
MIESWQPVKFGDIADKRTEAWRPGEPEQIYVGLEHIAPYELQLISTDSSIGLASNKTRFESGDVLFGKLRPYFRKVVRPPFGGVCSTDIWALFPKDTRRVAPGYLHWLIADPAFSEFANSAETGTRMPRASWEWVASFDVALPPLEEQRRISVVLGALYERIEVAGRLVGLLSAAAQTLSATAPGVCSVSDIASTERMQWYPDRQVGDIVDHYSLPAFDVGIGPERVEASEIASNKLLVCGPRVLFSRLNPDTNRTWLCIPEEDVTASVCSTEYAVLVPEKTTVGRLWAVLSSGEVGDVLAAATTGTSASHQRVREDAVLGATIADPRSLSEEDQITIDTYVETVLEKVRELKSLRQARDFLLPRLISGELRVEESEAMAEAAL